MCLFIGLYFTRPATLKNKERLCNLSKIGKVHFQGRGYDRRTADCYPL
jgi:hypothetical protein